MPVFLGEETHRHDYDEVAAPVLDKVLSVNSTSVNGAPTFNQPTVTTDGADDAIVFGNPIFDATADFTFYLMFKILEATDGVSVLIHDYIDSGSFVQLGWDDLNKVNSFRFFGGSSSLAQVNLNIGRLPLVTEKFVSMFTWTVATKTMAVNIASDHPTDPISMNGSDTSTGFPKNNCIICAVCSNCRLIKRRRTID